MKIDQKVLEVWKSLSLRERRLLHSQGRASTNSVLRVHCKIILALVAGHGARTIAKSKLGSVSQVYRVAERFVEEGPAGLADRREDNGETKADEDYQAVILELVGESSPPAHGYRRPTWTQELLILVAEKKTGLRVSPTTMSRLLRKLKIRWGRPKPIVGCPWKKRRRLQRLRHIQRLVENLPPHVVVLYVDEVDIHLNPKIGPDYMLRGTQKTVLTPGKNEKRYLAGAFNARTGRLTWVESDCKNSDLFIEQLWRLVREDYPRARHIHIILDNYRIHSSRRTQLALTALADRVTLHFLPPYCPDHNRIERVWKDLHDNVTRNHRCRTMDQLMAEVRLYLAEKDLQLRAAYKAKKAA